MSRFRLEHPTRPGVYAAYGNDPVMGFFVDVFEDGREKPNASYDFFHPVFNRAGPLMGALDFLVAEGLFTGEDLEDALIAIADNLDATSESVQRVVEVVMAFKAADGA